MSDNIKYGSSFTQRTGIGLSRKELNPGISSVSKRPAKKSPLLTPSPLKISGASLGNSTKTFHQYSRLGGSKNLSAPNVCQATDETLDVKDQSHMNENIATPERRSIERRQLQTTGLLFTGRSSHSDKPVGNTEYRKVNHVTQKQVENSVNRSDSFTHIQNVDLKPGDEEDVVKNTGNQTDTAYVEITSISLTNNNLGINSPRIETNMDVSSTLSVTDADYSPDKNNSILLPVKPLRSKHSAKKQKISMLEQTSQNRDKLLKLSQAELQCEAQQGNSTSTNSSTMSREIQGDENCNCPVAKPKVHKRLTRSFSLRHLEDDEYIGFASLPEQVHRKAVRRGFEFTLMVVGETGLGKSTLINSLFLTDLYKNRKVGNIEEKTVELEKKELEIEERGVKLKLTIVDTPGFNDAVNAEESWKPVVNYIDEQFDAYLTAESGVNRRNIQDTRVHCCLYFISPYGHGLRPVDVMVMKKLHHKVNIIPLIAKSDMLTKQEVKRLKERVLQEIQSLHINIYQYPDCDSDEDEEFKLQDTQLKKSIPFAVVGSNTIVEAGGNRIRGRMYPWGIVEVENPVHSDFIKLRQMLISTHMQDLKDVTCDVLYENYRAEHISEHMTSIHRERGKLKRDSAANLESSLATEQLLQEKEKEIKQMQEMLAKMQAQLHNSNSLPTRRVNQL